MKSLLYLVGAKEIMERNVSMIKEACEEVLQAYKRTLTLELVRFGISAYDADPRALFDIPEVRIWCKVLTREVPYVLSLVEDSTLDWLLPCIAEIEIVNRTAQDTAFRFRTESAETIKEAFKAGNELFGRIAINEEEFRRLCEAYTTRFEACLRQHGLLG